MRQLGPPSLLVTALVMAALLGWSLWFAYEAQEILLPLPNRARMVKLEEEPGFFWTTVVLFTLLLPCCVVGAYSAIDEMISTRRLLKNRARPPGA